mgnify:CR=1 FL=1
MGNNSSLSYSLTSMNYGSFFNQLTFLVENYQCFTGSNFVLTNELTRKTEKYFKSHLCPELLYTS